MCFFNFEFPPSKKILSFGPAPTGRGMRQRYQARSARWQTGRDPRRSCSGARRCRSVPRRKRCGCSCKQPERRSTKNILLKTDHRSAGLPSPDFDVFVEDIGVIETGGQSGDGLQLRVSSNTRTPLPKKCTMACGTAQKEKTRGSLILPR